MRQNEKAKYKKGQKAGAAPGSASSSRALARGLKPDGPCELCGGSAHLVHHVDGDPFNNDLGNLERLCKNCHRLRHSHQPNRLRAMRVSREEVTRLIRKHNLSPLEFDSVCAFARRQTGLNQIRKEQVKTLRLPKVMTEEALAKFFAKIDSSGNLDHQMMFRLLFFTGIRVSELCGIKLSHVYLTDGKIMIEQGKGHKDRYVPIPDRFRLTLKAYVEQSVARDRHRTFLFESRQKRAYSTRRVEQLTYEYSVAAEIPRVHPHLLRHQALTYLTKSGLTDSQIQLISGHSSKASLEKYQHLSLADVKEGYEKAMREVEI